MSGGFFNYEQFKIKDIEDRLEVLKRREEDLREFSSTMEKERNIEEQREEEKKNLELLNMIDGAYEIVELWGFNSDSEYQKQWAKDWLEKAKSLGAHADW